MRNLSLEYCLREWMWATVCEKVDEECMIEDAWINYIKNKHCKKCNNLGWAWEFELDDSIENSYNIDTMIKYCCDWCKKSEEDKK
jgi:hypothetical protein